MDNLGEWKLRKYARAVISGPNEGKEWESLLSSPEKPLILSLSKGGILKVQMENDLLEYWNLLGAKDVRTFIRESCILFLCKAKGLVRKWRIQFCGGTSASNHCCSCYTAINKFLTEPCITVDHVMADKPGSSMSKGNSSSQSSIVAAASLPASSTLAEPGGTPTAGNAVKGLVKSKKNVTKRPSVKKRKSDGGGCARTRTDFGHGFKRDENLPKALDLIHLPGLETMVKATVQDPNFPDLVEAVHRVISNM
ncbi:uncharacterized protein [Palaemon carinicauda]|uniref:uncharacterized protein n=1 Tax=Palaemon carinicauda TaxID=392227 RepID=UPI0035B638AD